MTPLPIITSNYDQLRIDIKRTYAVFVDTPSGKRILSQSQTTYIEIFLLLIPFIRAFVYGISGMEVLRTLSIMGAVYNAACILCIFMFSYSEKNKAGMRSGLLLLGCNAFFGWESVSLIFGIIRYYIEMEYWIF